MVALGDLCTAVGGGTPTRTNPEFYGSDIPWVTPKDMKRWNIGESQIGITHLGLEKSAARLVPEGSVLIVVRSGVLKHTLPVGLAGVQVAINQDMKALLCNSDVAPDYLARFVKWKSGEILQWVRATTADNFSIDKLKQLPVPLPPLPEQRRIAAILDHADALRAKRREALARLDELTQSIFIDMFENDREVAQTVKLEDVASVSSGITKGRKLPSAPLQEVPYLAVANVQDKALDLSAVKTIAVTDAEIDKYRLECNDLLLTEGGDPDKLGRGCLWNSELPEAIHQNHIFRVRPDTERVNPVFLNWAVGSRRGKAYFLRSAKQTTGIASINMSQLKAFPLPLPALSFQEEFARRVEGIGQMKTRQLNALAELDALFASLQYRAFRSEL
ncbi:restriction endonuclease subunit S [Rhodococcus sp. TAF43]|uniref:restriction endonuclease subunit S n=1 Tax=Rhodococcus sp. TAF43 TaxID=3237483 RepID=UPI003F962CE1